MSANLSKDVTEQLVAFSGEHDVKLSPVVDLALRRFFAQPVAEQERALARYLADKPCKSRDAWRRSFWRFFSEEFGVADAIDNPLAPRTFENYVTVALLNNVGGDGKEHEPLYIWTGPQMVTDSRNSQRQFQFPRLSSPAAAAEEVARWIRDQA